MASNSKVGCSLKFFEANNTSTTATDATIIQLRIRLRYQLCVKAHGVEFLVDDIFAPESVTSFAMPLSVLMSCFSVMFVSNVLEGLDMDARVRDLSSPKIAKFAFDMAKRHGAAVSGFMTVAHVLIHKIDYIGDKEFHKILNTLKPESIGGSRNESVLEQYVKLEDQSS